jgi:hypothetical protein
MSAPTTNSTATDNDQLPPVAPVQKCTKCAIERDVSWFLSQVPGKTNRQCRACLDRDASYKKKRVWESPPLQQISQLTLTRN